MRKIKRLVGVILAMAMIMSFSIPVFASEPETRSSVDSTIPRTFIGYSSGLDTGTRYKEDYSYIYISNTAGFNLKVVAKATVNNSNQTRGKYAIVPIGEYFITNSVRENGYDRCFLNIKTATVGTSGYVTGKWSPDSVGSYPVVN